MDGCEGGGGGQQGIQPHQQRPHNMRLRLLPRHFAHLSKPGPWAK